MPLDLTPVRLTLELAAITTALLLVIGTPLAWWMSQTPSRFKQPVASLIALPLVLPPTVIGFYLLLLLGPDGPVGRFTESIGLGLLPFTFPGLVVGSVIYSLPFLVQPVYNAFESIGTRPLEVAATLRAPPLVRFFTVALPLALPGILSGAILAFAHTVGEFGVILMIGGNIPGETKVLSVAIYDHVESLEWDQAHWLAAGMVLFSFLVVLSVNLLGQRMRRIGHE